MALIPPSCPTIFLFSLLLILSISSATPTPSKSTQFIRTSCTATRYPALCFQSLSAFAASIHHSPRQLAHTALALSLSRARSASAFVSKLSTSKGMSKRETAAVKDCVDNMGDTVDRLSRSIRELKSTAHGGSSFAWQMSNVETWVSAALTDENTCVDGFAGRGMDGKVKAAIRSKMVNVAQVTSNALALVNKLAPTYLKKSSLWVDAMGYQERKNYGFLIRSDRSIDDVTKTGMVGVDAMHLLNKNKGFNLTFGDLLEIGDKYHHHLKEMTWHWICCFGETPHGNTMFPLMTAWP